MKQHASILSESGKEILYIDFSGLRGDDFLAAIEQVKNFCLRLPADKHYPSITDLTDASVSKPVRESMRQMEKAISQNKGPEDPGIVKVVIGLNKLERLVAGAITKNIQYTDTRTEAIARILAQGHNA